MRPKIVLSIILFVIMLATMSLVGCTQAPPLQTEVPATEPVTLPESQSSPASDAESLKNLEYRLGIVKEARGDSDGVIKLTDGRFEQAIQNSAANLRVDYVDSAIGDLNGDGVEDAVVLLAINTGGSGTFMQLAAVLNQDGQLRHIDTADLGDRTKVNSIQIQNGTIKLQTIVHSDTDPQCCPSLENLQEYILQGDLLVNP